MTVFVFKQLKMLMLGGFVKRYNGMCIISGGLRTNYFSNR
jgi:hypothetical protein